MRTRQTVITLLVIAVIALTAQTGCSRDPKVRREKYLESGQRYYDQGKFREAVIQFGNAVQADPRWPEGHYRLGLAHLSLQAWQSAYADFNRAISLDENYLPARVKLGSLLLASGDVIAAEEQADFVLSKDASNAEAMALEADVLQAHGKGKEALAEMEQALQHSGDSKLLLNMALLQAQNRNLPLAEEYLKKAAEKNDPQARMALADVYTSQQRWDDAEQQLKLAIQEQPKQFLPRQKLAGLYLMRKKNDRALQLLQQAKNDLADDTAAIRGVANYYYQAGDMDKAISEYADLVRQHPKNAAFKQAELALLLSRNRLDEARKLFAELEKSSPKATETMLAHSELLIREGKFADAVRVAEDAVKQDQSNPLAHHQLGLAMKLAGKPEGAESEFRQAVKLDPNLLPALRELAPLAWARKDMVTLEQCADTIIKLQPGAYDGYLFRALVEDSRKQDDKSLADLQKAVSLAPSNPEPLNQLGAWYGERKRMEEARESFEQALTLDPNNSAAMFNLMKVFRARNDTSGAVARLRTQIAIVPNNAAFHVILGQLLGGMKDFTRAEEELNKALALQPTSATYGSLTVVQLSAGKLDAAIATTDRWITAQPNDVMAYMNKGSLMERKGDPDQALQLFQKALQIKPDFPVAANNAAYLLLTQGKDLDVALTLAQTARRGLPDSPSTADTLGWAYYQKGTYRMAINLFQEAARKEPKNASYHYHLGMAYDKLNERGKAKAELERALQLDPKIPEAREVHQTLQELNRG
jgi:tetratricopeptide (TPR) repeat protein